MKHFVVSWCIDVEGDMSPREAAQEALKIQRDPMSTAVFFSVKDAETGQTDDIDLLDDETGGEVTPEVLERMPVTAQVQ